MTRRLSVCYAAPGQFLLPSAGPTRNVLSVAEALSEWADVTVAFRRQLEAPGSDHYRVLEFEPTATVPAQPVDDAAVRGMTPRQLWTYLRSLRRFARTEARTFDVILEKSWLLPGFLAHQCRRGGPPVAVVENLIRGGSPASPRHALLPHLRQHVIQRRARHYLRRAPLILAETAELAAQLHEAAGVDPQRVHVVPLGVDRQRFFPREQAAARAELQRTSSRCWLLYFGVLDRAHDLVPLLTAIREAPTLDLELHVVGDGEERGRYEQLGQDPRVFFHGRCPPAQIPLWINAADLCVAPYAPDFFAGGKVGYASLKIPEAMACARPVATTPSGSLQRWIKAGVSGFLVEPDPASWRRFLEELPAREGLRRVGAAAAAAVQDVSWGHTAREYLRHARVLCDAAP